MFNDNDGAYGSWSGAAPQYSADWQYTPYHGAEYFPAVSSFSGYSIRPSLSGHPQVGGYLNPAAWNCGYGLPAWPDTSDRRSVFEGDSVPPPAVAERDIREEPVEACTQRSQDGASPGGEIQGGKGKRKAYAPRAYPQPTDDVYMMVEADGVSLALPRCKPGRVEVPARGRAAHPCMVLLCGCAIIMSPTRKLGSAGITEWVEKHYGSAIRNRDNLNRSIRHILSIHDDFIKGRQYADQRTLEGGQKSDGWQGVWALKAPGDFLRKYQKSVYRANVDVAQPLGKRSERELSSDWSLSKKSRECFFQQQSSLFYYPQVDMSPHFSSWNYGSDFDLPFSAPSMISDIRSAATDIAPVVTEGEDEAEIIATTQVAVAGNYARRIQITTVRRGWREHEAAGPRVLPATGGPTVSQSVQQPVDNAAVEVKADGNTYMELKAGDVIVRLPPDRQMFQSKIGGRLSRKETHPCDVLLCGCAILTSPAKQLSSAGITKWISKHYPSAMRTREGLNNRVRHILSFYRYFAKTKSIPEGGSDEQVRKRTVGWDWYVVNPRLFLRMYEKSVRRADLLKYR